ncbi:hypothetical protein PFISCL1PPCAC_8979, partial [Pristionchus fissidentatus]
LSPVASLRASISVRRKMYPQLKWRERRLNWNLFDGYSFPNVLKYSTFYNYMFVSFWFAFIIFPFAHILFIVIRSGRTLNKHKSKRTHLRQAKTVIVQVRLSRGFVLLPYQFAVSSAAPVSGYA